jgi:hypothetical protein
VRWMSGPLAARAVSCSEHLPASCSASSPCPCPRPLHSPGGSSAAASAVRRQRQALRAEAPPAACPGRRSSLPERARTARRCSAGRGAGPGISCAPRQGSSAAAPDTQPPGQQAPGSQALQAPPSLKRRPPDSPTPRPTPRPAHLQLKGRQQAQEPDDRVEVLGLPQVRLHASHVQPAGALQEPHLRGRAAGSAPAGRLGPCRPPHQRCRANSIMRARRGSGSSCCCRCCCGCVQGGWAVCSGCAAHPAQQPHQLVAPVDGDVVRGQHLPELQPEVLQPQQDALVQLQVVARNLRRRIPRLRSRQAARAPMPLPPARRNVHPPPPAAQPPSLPAPHTYTHAVPSPSPAAPPTICSSSEKMRAR